MTDEEIEFLFKKVFGTMSLFSDTVSKVNIKVKSYNPTTEYTECNTYLDLVNDKLLEIQKLSK